MHQVLTVLLFQLFCMFEEFKKKKKKVGENVYSLDRKIVKILRKSIKL